MYWILPVFFLITCTYCSCEPLNEIPEIEAVQIYYDLEDDEKHANNFYQDRLLCIRGKVFRTAEERYHDPCLFLYGDKQGDKTVCCLFSRKNFLRVRDVKALETVSICGNGFIRDDRVYLRNCYLREDVQGVKSRWKKSFDDKNRKLERSSYRFLVSEIYRGGDPEHTKVRAKIRNHSFSHSRRMHVSCIAFDENYQELARSTELLTEYSLMPSEERSFLFSLYCSYSQVSSVTFEISD